MEMCVELRPGNYGRILPVDRWIDETKLAMIPSYADVVSVCIRFSRTGSALVGTSSIQACILRQGHRMAASELQVLNTIALSPLTITRERHESWRRVDDRKEIGEDWSICVTCASVEW